MTIHTLVEDTEIDVADHSEQNDYLTRREAAALIVSGVSGPRKKPP